MSLTLRIDTDAWRAHLRRTADSIRGLVPVAKGNGYGFTLPRLVQEATLLDAPVLAVGIAEEVAVVRAAGWDRDVVVLTPWSPADGTALLADDRLIVTVSRLENLRALIAARPDARVILEVLTSMRRHGLAVSDLPRAAEIVGGSGLRLEGWTIHLPMVAHAEEARSLARAALDAANAPLWLSHLSVPDYDAIREEFEVKTHLRVGTALWLGAPATRRVVARVLDVHPVARGERVGYWQHRVPRAGYVVVVGGGTANGIAMEAPTSAHTVRQRGIALASGGMEALGLALSPYRIDGRKRFFVEPPHMQSSLVFLPSGAGVAIGDEIPVEARLTAVTFDSIEG